MKNQRNENPNLPENEKSFQRARNMIISVVIAIAIWVLVVNVVNPEITVTVSDVPVSFVGESYLRDRGFVIVERDRLPEFSLRVKGTRRDLLSSMKRISVEVDVSDIDKKGKITIGTRVNVPERLSIQKQEFSSVELYVEPRHDKKIPVFVEQIGDEEQKNDGKIVSSVSELEEITISGSVSDVENVKACIVTVDVSQLRSDGKSVHEYRLVDQDGKPLADETSVYCANSVVGVNNTIFDRHTLDIEVEVHPLLKREFKVEYNIRDIGVPVQDVGLASGGELPAKLNAVIPYGDYERGERTVELQFQSYDDVYIPDRTMALKVNLIPMKEQKSSVRIELKNIPDGLKSDKTELVAEMKLLIPEDMTEEITATVDCSEFKEGTNEGRIKYSNEYIQAVDLDKISVNLSYKETE